MKFKNFRFLLAWLRMDRETQAYVIAIERNMRSPAMRRRLKPTMDWLVKTARDIEAFEKVSGIEETEKFIAKHFSLLK